MTKTLQIDYTRHSIGDKRLLTMAAMVLVYACAWFAATGVGIATAEAGITSSPDKAAPLVQICRRENQFYLYRGDELYYVKGVGGDRYLESAAAAGAMARVRSRSPWASMRRADRPGPCGFGSVPTGHMADLVTQNSRQFGLGIQVGQHAAGDIDIAAGQCKGVDLGAVDDGEMIFKSRAMAVLRQILADSLHQFIEHRVMIGRHLFADFGAVSLSQAYLLFFGHQYKITATGYRIGGTR